MTKNAFSQEVISIKTKMGLSNESLAKKLGVSKHSVQAWCTGRRSPSEPMKNHVRNLMGSSNLVDWVDSGHNDRNKGDDVYLIKIMELQEQIIGQQKEIMNLRESLSDKMANGLPTWELVDYDVITQQSYDMTDDSYSFFDSYNMVRREDFFAKLGYFGKEADMMWDNHRKSMFKKYAKDKDFKNISIISNKEYGKWLVDSTNTYDTFQKLKSQGINIQTMMNLEVKYLHKDGSDVHALLFVLIDVKLNSSITKIKFLDNLERN